MPVEPKKTTEERLAYLEARVERLSDYVKEVAPEFSLKPSLQARNEEIVRKRKSRGA